MRQALHLVAQRVSGGDVIINDDEAPTKQSVESAQQLVVVHASAAITLKHTGGNGVREVEPQTVANVRLNWPRAWAVHQGV